MNILHITSHMGDGAGKAIGGLTALDCAAGNRDAILLLEAPKKMNHILRCQERGIDILTCDKLDCAMAEADVVVLNWWGGGAMERFLRTFPQVPCRVLLWTHKNGFYDPPLPQKLVDACDGLLVTSPLTQTEARWEDSTLVYGFGAFEPEKVQAKSSYRLEPGIFRIGYLGMPGYKRFPKNALDYLRAALSVLPSAHFIMAGECDPAFRREVERAEFSSRVSLLGWVENVEKLLADFDVFAYLLRADSSATTENSVLEAMAAGLPIAMSREPVGRYVLGEECGILFDGPEDFSRALTAFYENEALRLDKGTQARLRAIDAYNCRENYSRFATACAHVVEKSKTVHTMLI